MGPDILADDGSVCYLVAMMTVVSISSENLLAGQRFDSSILLIWSPLRMRPLCGFAGNVGSRKGANEPETVSRIRGPGAAQ
jgi:hypothetical protein